MNDNFVGFPKEADNTQFSASPVMSVEKFHDTLRELIDRQNIGELIAEELDFEIANEFFDGTLRMFITTDHLTNEFERRPELFFLSGIAILLDIDGEETDVYLQVGGQVEFLDEQSDVQLGTLTVWRMQTDPGIGLRDAS